MSPRRQRPLSARARQVLEAIPPEFQDDGCSSAPDDLFGFDLRFACRCHDFYYCSRAWPAGWMDQAQRRAADELLGELVREALPWRWRWVGWIYRVAVRRHGGTEAFDSCGPEAGPRCRHNLAPPDWMRADLRRWGEAP